MHGSLHICILELLSISVFFSFLLSNARIYSKYKESRDKILLFFIETLLQIRKCNIFTQPELRNFNS